MGSGSAASTVDPVLEAGRYCYDGEKPLMDGYELTVSNDGSVEARGYAFAADDPTIDLTMENLFFASGEFTSDDEFELDIRIWSPDGFSPSTSSFTVVDGDLQPSRYPEWLAVPAECDIFDGWAMGTEGLPIFTNEEISFETGASSGSVEGSAIRGEVALYTLEAAEGQTMTVSIDSLEDNGAVRVTEPGGAQIALLDGNGETTFVLPADGVYDLVVSSIRGNVTFTLDVEIR